MKKINVINLINLEGGNVFAAEGHDPETGVLANGIGLESIQ
jgi:hypothetical protein